MQTMMECPHANQGLTAVGAGGPPPDQLVKASRKLNRFLKRFISKTDSTHLREMRPNTAMNRVLRFPPELSDSNRSIVYGDTQFLFQNLLILGVEFDMLMLNILVSCIVSMQAINDSNLTKILSLPRISVDRFNDTLQTWSVMDLWLDDTAHNNPVAAALVTWVVEKVFCTFAVPWEA